jgi:hypothetical protein
LRAAPRADPVERISRIRLLARVIATRVVPSAILLPHTVSRPCVRRMVALEWHCPCAAAFPPAPPHQSSQFVRSLRRYYAAVRLPRFVHRRRQLHPSRRGLRWTAPEDCSLADESWLSRFPPTMRLSMPRSPTPPGLRRPCQYRRRSVAFRALGPRRHPKVAPLFRGSLLGLHILCQRFRDDIAAARA